jgi:hypothetical protein
MTKSRVVPPPGGLTTFMRPPSTSIRSLSPMSPEPLRASTPPIPSSEIRRLRLPSVARARTFTSEA